MSENRFMPLMAEFLRQIANEVENNKALARRLAEPFQAILNEAVAEAKAEKKKTGSGSSKTKKYPVPEGFDPYKIFYDEGSPGLYNRLQALEVEELKGVLTQFTNLPRPEYVRKQNHEILVQMVVQGVKEITSRGQAFGDYKMGAE